MSARDRLHLPALGLVCGLLWQASALASAITINNVATRLGDDGTYSLRAELEMDFSADALEALSTGIPLIFLAHTRVVRERAVLWDPTVAEAVRYYQIRYHALTEQYVVRNLTQNTQESFHTRASAIDSLGVLDELRLIGKQRLVGSGVHYTAGLRVSLDHESLPSPMRPWVWFSNDWQFDSGWHTWRLK